MAIHRDMARRRGLGRWGGGGQRLVSHGGELYEICMNCYLVLNRRNVVHAAVTIPHTW